MSTCRIKGCSRTFKQGDKHPAGKVWQIGYYSSGLWYCSAEHLHKGTRREGLITFGVGICVVSALMSIIFIIMPLLDKQYFELTDNTVAFYVSLVVCPLGFWGAKKLEKLN